LLLNDKPRQMLKQRQTKRARLSASQRRRPNTQEDWQKTAMRVVRKMRLLDGNDCDELSRSLI
jgi:hypothetical protein